ncbi:exgA, partial [Symbiodinium necroappetens]
MAESLEDHLLPGASPSLEVFGGEGDFLQESILDEEQERAWYSQAEDTEASSEWRRAEVADGISYKRRCLQIILFDPSTSELGKTVAAEAQVLGDVFDLDAGEGQDGVRFEMFRECGEYGWRLMIRLGSTLSMPFSMGSGMDGGQGNRGASDWPPPTWCERLGCWGSEEMGSSEGTAYLREALILSGAEESEVRDYGTHSLKATLLTWTSQNILFPFNDVEQRALGHHLDANAKSQVTYATTSSSFMEKFCRLSGAALSAEQARRSESESSSSVSAASTSGFQAAVGATDPIAKKNPAAERISRAQRQQQRITGLVYTPDTTPAHFLTDLFVEQLDQGVISWISPDRCTSRSMEMASQKRDKSLQLAQDGSVKLSSKVSEVKCDVSSDAKLRSAFQRRSLALDLAGLCNFVVVETWITHLFAVMAREVPEGYQPVSLRQVISADRHLFQLMSEDLPADLSSQPGHKSPVDERIEKYMYSAEVAQFLTPLQRHDVSPGLIDKRKQDDSVPPPPPPFKKAKKGEGDSKTFISGAFVHGGITSIMNNVSSFPWCTRLFTGFVRKHATSGVKFSTVAIFQNVQTTPHVDARNCPASINHVFQISEFRGGRVILQDPNGELQLEHQGKILRGSPLEFRDQQARFCAKDRLHWTESWSGGPRIVLIAYTVRSLAKLTPEQTLSDVGFSLPRAASAPKSVPSPASPSGELVLGQQPVALELFAGTGSLSKALRAAGFQTFALDHHVAHAKVPILKVDLVTFEGQGLVWKQLMWLFQAAS